MRRSMTRVLCVVLAACAIGLPACEEEDGEKELLREKLAESRARYEQLREDSRRRYDRMQEDLQRRVTSEQTKAQASEADFDVAAAICVSCAVAALLLLLLLLRERRSKKVLVKLFHWLKNGRR